jgi:hypothetical protein
LHGGQRFAPIALLNANVHDRRLFRPLLQAFAVTVAHSIGEVICVYACVWDESRARVAAMGRSFAPRERSGCTGVVEYDIGVN